MTSRWTLDDIDWQRFDPSRVDPELVRVVKAASMVESNGRLYAQYLANVFADDPEFRQAALDWADEEVQHGVALGRWARMADPAFDYDDSLARFRDGYRLELNVDASVRGSRTGELIARCMVEVGTSSYYTALADATSEPVLKQISKKIAADELRHYRLFYTHMKRYLEREQLSRPRRVWVALSRIAESEDDELAYAYYSANDLPGPYNRAASREEYFRRAYAMYRPWHLDRAVAMIFKAVGLNPQGALSRVLTRVASSFVESRARRLARAAA